MPEFKFYWTGEQSPTSVELPDERAARGQAVTTTGEILRDLDVSFPMPGEFEMIVRDADDNIVISISVRARPFLAGESEQAGRLN